MKNLRLMVVDDDDFEAMLTGAALSELGHHVDKFASTEIAMQALTHMPGKYDAVVADAESRSGSQFARELQSSEAGVIVLRKANLLADLAAAVERVMRLRQRMLPAAA